MTYYNVISNDIPDAIDITSSPTTVYIRRNIHSIEVDDETTGEKRKEYRYEEASVTKDEYINMLTGRQEETDEAVQELILSVFGGE